MSRKDTLEIIQLNRSLSSGEKWTLTVLAFLIASRDLSQSCAVDYDELQLRTGFSRPTLSTHLKRLEKSGCLEIVRLRDVESQRWLANVYKLGAEIVLPSRREARRAVVTRLPPRDIVPTLGRENHG